VVDGDGVLQIMDLVVPALKKKIKWSLIIFKKRN
jgi:hypothetical protein